jgi:hypothetical protein
MSDILPFYIINQGFNSPSLTANFLDYLKTIIHGINEENTLIIPSDRISPYDGLNIYKYILKNNQNLLNYNLTFIAFSAGVVGAIIAGNLWQKKGGKVKTLFAFDGWGVPLIADFPCYRISHDYFTHLSYLGGEKNAFYASPSVSHLDLWRSPEEIQGWWQIGLGIKKRANLGEFLQCNLTLNI